MTDERKRQKTEKAKIEELELNKEALQDLSELEIEQVEGGGFGRIDAFAGVPTLRACSR